MLGSLWRGWLRVTMFLGMVQMVIALTVVYWLLMPLLVIPFKLLSDPLRLKKPGGTPWVERVKTDDVLTDMRRQG